VYVCVCVHARVRMNAQCMCVALNTGPLSLFRCARRPVISRTSCGCAYAYICVDLMCVYEQCILLLYEGFLDIFKTFCGEGCIIIQICNCFFVIFYCMLLTSNKLWVHQTAALMDDNFFSLNMKFIHRVLSSTVIPDVMCSHQPCHESRVKIMRLGL
jgi:hypothetical protein